MLSLVGSQRGEIVAARGLYKPRKGDPRHVRLFRGYWNPERRKLRMEREYGTLPQPTGANAATAKGGATEGFLFGLSLGYMFVVTVQLLLGRDWNV
mmetsp:Transcript_16581/g.23925  ORF Transcript_16581/g.23925 Transcript_16581/m.23925 type:complete len:96 (-) Transcript_16581:276-563(-)